MYVILLIFLVLALFFGIFYHRRKKKVISKIQTMDQCLKLQKIDGLLRPFGYCFHEKSGFFSSTLDAWQREKGYTWFYDYMAPRFGIVLDSLPVYFDYDGKTWLIEFWKGQYGINAGAEIGIYHAGDIVSENDYRTTHFAAASDEEMLDCAFVLCDKNGECVRIEQRHWWLTAFLPGYFASPAELSMKAAVKFPNRRMQFAFWSGLRRAGCAQQDIAVGGLGVTVNFRSVGKVEYKLVTRFWRGWSQCVNRILCGLYMRVTKPFVSTQDRVLCLYCLIPAAFRGLFRARCFDRRFHCKSCCGKGRL